MERIELTKNQKRILLDFKNKDYIEPQKEDYEDFRTLAFYGLVKNEETMGDKIAVSFLIDKGRVYLHENPKLKNPSILQDKKYIITTIISIGALLISALALYFSLR